MLALFCMNNNGIGTGNNCCDLLHIIFRLFFVLRIYHSLLSTALLHRLTLCIIWLYIRRLFLSSLVEDNKWIKSHCNISLPIMLMGCFIDYKIIYFFLFSPLRMTCLAKWLISNVLNLSRSSSFSFYSLLIIKLASTSASRTNVMKVNATSLLQVSFV